MENPLIMLLICAFLLYQATKLAFVEEKKTKSKKNLKTYKFLENKKMLNKN